MRYSDVIGTDYKHANKRPPHFSSLQFQSHRFFYSSITYNPTLSATMSDVLSEKVSSDAGSDVTTLSQRFQDQLEAILRKLRTDPSSITAEEARILSENVTTRDDRAVRIISAVESLAIANKVCIIRNPNTLRLFTVPC
jgi:hypothetical protein